MGQLAAPWRQRLCVMGVQIGSHEADAIRKQPGWQMRGVPRYADLMISSIGEISRERVFKSPLGHKYPRIFPDSATA